MAVKNVYVSVTWLLQKCKLPQSYAHYPQANTFSHWDEYVDKTGRFVHKLWKTFHRSDRMVLTLRTGVKCDTIKEITLWRQKHESTVQRSVRGCG